MLKNIAIAIIVGLVIGAICVLAGIGAPWPGVVGGVVAVAIVWTLRMRRAR